MCVKPGLRTPTGSSTTGKEEQLIFDSWFKQRLDVKLLRPVETRKALGLCSMELGIWELECKERYVRNLGASRLRQQLGGEVFRTTILDLVAKILPKST